MTEDKPDRASLPESFVVNKKGTFRYLSTVVFANLFQSSEGRNAEYAARHACNAAVALEKEWDRRGWS